MKSATAPVIDSRSAREIYAELVGRLSAPREAGGLGIEQDRLVDALAHIAARYAEIVIERLNQAPDKHYRSFLNLLGIARVPPRRPRVF